MFRLKRLSVGGGGFFNVGGNIVGCRGGIGILNWKVIIYYLY